MFLPPGPMSCPVGHSFDVNQSRRQMGALAIKQHPLSTATEKSSLERLISSVRAKMTGVTDANEQNESGGGGSKIFPEMIRCLSSFLTLKSIKCKQRMLQNESSYK